MLESQCSLISEILFRASLSSIWWHVSEFILFVGLLGNLVNIIVFSHERMKSYMNPLFYWLAGFNCLVLTLIAVLSFVFGTGFATHTTSVDLLDDRFHIKFYTCFILISFYTVTVHLNIAVAASLYMAKMHPQKFKLWCSGCSKRQTLVGMLVLSFISWTPHLVLLSAARTTEFVDLFFIASTSSYKWLQFISSEIASNLPLVLLLIVCIALISGVAKTRQGYRVLGADSVETAGVEGGGAVDRFTKEMANMTLPIVQICVFSIALITIMLIPLFSLVQSTVLPFDLKNSQVTRCYYLTHAFLNTFVISTLLVSSSYNIFCYLKSAHYRETLGVLLRSGYDRLKRMFEL